MRDLSLFQTLVHNSIREILLSASDLLWPPDCVVCHGRSRREELVCPECRARFVSAAGWRCPLCEVLLPPDNEPCPICGPSTTPILADFSAWWFTPAPREAVHTLKYLDRPELGPYLGNLLGEAMMGRGEVPADMIIGIPLHRTRRRERGYNQSQELASGLAARVGLPCRNDLLRRIRATRSQTLLTPSQRAANVAGAFAVADPAQIKGRRILLVDDVMTTGATLRAAAEALAQAGAGEIRSVTVCKAGRPPSAMPPVTEAEF